MSETEDEEKGEAHKRRAHKDNVRWTLSYLQRFSKHYLRHTVLYKLRNDQDENSESAKRTAAWRAAARREVARGVHAPAHDIPRLEEAFRVQFTTKLRKLVRAGVAAGRGAKASLARAPRWVRRTERKLRFLPAIVEELQKQESSVGCLAGLVGEGTRPAHFLERLAEALETLGGPGAAGAFEALAARWGCAPDALPALWARARDLALGKLRLHMARGDRPPAALPTPAAPGAAAAPPESLLMSRADWRVVDLTLTHDHTVHLLAEESFKMYDQMQTLTVLFELVQVCELEERGTREDWARALHMYNNRGTTLSLVTLQRRWHELKADSRARVGAAWRAAPGPAPRPLHLAVARRFPHVVCSPLPTWQELVSAGRVYQELPGGLLQVPTCVRGAATDAPAPVAPAPVAPAPVAPAPVAPAPVAPAPVSSAPIPPAASLQIKRPCRDTDDDLIIVEKHIETIDVDAMDEDRHETQGRLVIDESAETLRKMVKQEVPDQRQELREQHRERRTDLRREIGRIEEQIRSVEGKSLTAVVGRPTVDRWLHAAIPSDFDLENIASETIIDADETDSDVELISDNILDSDKSSTHKETNIEKNISAGQLQTHGNHTPGDLSKLSTPNLNNLDTENGDVNRNVNAPHMDATQPCLSSLLKIDPNKATSCMLIFESDDDNDENDFCNLPHSENSKDSCDTARSDALVIDDSKPKDVEGKDASYIKSEHSYAHNSNSKPQVNTSVRSSVIQRNISVTSAKLVIDASWMNRMPSSEAEPRVIRVDSTNLETDKNCYEHIMEKKIEDDATIKNANIMETDNTRLGNVNANENGESKNKEITLHNESRIHIVDKETKPYIIELEPLNIGKSSSIISNSEKNLSQIASQEHLVNETVAAFKKAIETKIIKNNFRIDEAQSSLNNENIHTNKNEPNAYGIIESRIESQTDLEHIIAEKLKDYHSKITIVNTKSSPYSENFNAKKEKIITTLTEPRSLPKYTFNETVEAFKKAIEKQVMENNSKLEKTQFSNEDIHMNEQIVHKVKGDSSSEQFAGAIDPTVMTVNEIVATESHIRELNESNSEILDTIETESSELVIDEDISGVDSAIHNIPNYSIVIDQGELQLKVIKSKYNIFDSIRDDDKKDDKLADFDEKLLMRPQVLLVDLTTVPFWRKCCAAGGLRARRRRPARATRTSDFLKNPDFNIELKHLSRRFLRSKRNLELMDACTPVSVDLERLSARALRAGRRRVAPALRPSLELGDTSSAFVCPPPRPPPPQKALPMPSPDELERLLHTLSSQGRLAPRVEHPPGIRPTGQAVGPGAHARAYCCGARKHRAVNDARRRLHARAGRAPPAELQLHWHPSNEPCTCCCARALSAESELRLHVVREHRLLHQRLQDILFPTRQAQSQQKSQTVSKTKPQEVKKKMKPKKNESRKHEKKEEEEESRELQDDYQEWIRQKNLASKYFNIQPAAARVPKPQTTLKRKSDILFPTTQAQPHQKSQTVSKPKPQEVKKKMTPKKNESRKHEKKQDEEESRELQDDYQEWIRQKNLASKYFNFQPAAARVPKPQTTLKRKSDPGPLETHEVTSRSGQKIVKLCRKQTPADSAGAARGGGGPTTNLMLDLATPHGSSTHQLVVRVDLPGTRADPHPPRTRPPAANCPAITVPQQSSEQPVLNIQVSLLSGPPEPAVADQEAEEVKVLPLTEQNLFQHTKLFEKAARPQPTAEAQVKPLTEKTLFKQTKLYEEAEDGPRRAEPILQPLGHTEREKQKQPVALIKTDSSVEGCSEPEIQRVDERNVGKRLREILFQRPRNETVAAVEKPADSAKKSPQTAPPPPAASAPEGTGASAAPPSYNSMKCPWVKSHSVIPPSTLPVISNVVSLASINTAQNNFGLAQPGPGDAIAPNNFGLSNVISLAGSDDAVAPNNFGLTNVVSQAGPGDVVAVNNFGYRNVLAMAGSGDIVAPNNFILTNVMSQAGPGDATAPNNFGLTNVISQAGSGDAIGPNNFGLSNMVSLAGSGDAFAPNSFGLTNVISQAGSCDKIGPNNFRISNVVSLAGSGHVVAPNSFGLSNFMSQANLGEAVTSNNFGLSNVMSLAGFGNAVAPNNFGLTNVMSQAGSGDVVAPNNFGLTNVMSQAGSGDVVAPNNFGLTNVMSQAGSSDAVAPNNFGLSNVVSLAAGGGTTLHSLANNSTVTSHNSFFIQTTRTIVPLNAGMFKGSAVPPGSSLLKANVGTKGVYVLQVPTAEGATLANGVGTATGCMLMFMQLEVPTAAEAAPTSPPKTVMSFSWTRSILASQFVRARDPTAMTVLCLDLSKPLLELACDYLLLTPLEVPLVAPSYWTMAPHKKSQRIIFDGPTDDISTPSAPGAKQVDEAAGGPAPAAAVLRVKSFAKQQPQLENALSNIGRPVAGDGAARPARAAPPDRVFSDGRLFKRLAVNKRTGLPLYAQVLTIVSDLATGRKLVVSEAPLLLYNMRTGVPWQVQRVSSLPAGALPPDAPRPCVGLRCDQADDALKELVKMLNITNNKKQKYRRIAPRKRALTGPRKPKSVAQGNTASVTPSDTASVAPGNAASVAPGNAASVAPSNPASVAPSNAVSVTPSNPASVASGNSESVAPDKPASVASGNSASIAPGKPASVASGNSASVAPGNAASVAPGNAASIALGNAASIALGNAASVVAPGNAASVAPGNAASVAPGNAASVVAPGNAASVAPSNPAYVASGNSASVASNKPASVASSNSASIAPGNPASVATGNSASVAPCKAASVATGGAASVAPGRAASVAPGRAVSVAPGRAASVAPGRAVSVAPGRAVSVAPGRAASVAPGKPASETPPAAMVIISLDSDDDQ